MLEQNVILPRQLREKFRTSGLWGDHGVLDWWDLAVRARPDCVAVVDAEGQKFTYSQADEASSRLATWMQECGVEAGDVVGMQLPNCSWCLVVVIAAYKVGAAVNPLSMSLRQVELMHAVEQCGMRVAVMFRGVRGGRSRGIDCVAFVEGLVASTSLEHVMFVPGMDGDTGELSTNEDAGGLSTDEAFTQPSADMGDWDDRKRAPSQESLPEDRAHKRDASALLSRYKPLEPQEWRRGGGEDIAVILFTSGSEAEPKGVMLSHNNVLASEIAFAHELQLGPNDKILMPSSVGHATGFLHGLIMPIVTRGMAVLVDCKDGDKLARIIARESVTCAMSVPTVVDALVSSYERRKKKMEGVRFLCCGGAPVPRSLLKRAREVGVRLYSVYGATESAPHTMTSFEDTDEQVATSDGKAVTGTDIKIVDPDTREILPAGAEGEEASRGPAVFSGYIGRPDLTAQVMDEEGWYYSGDLAVMDEKGYIRITGRRKDIIIRGGENISAAEVEKVLMEHPHVHQAAVVAMPDKVLGQRACAFVVARPGCSPLTVEDLLDYFVGHGIAKFKIPERVEYLDEMPLTGSGKLSKVELRRRAEKFSVDKEKCG